MAMMSVLLAHQGGWDEVLLVGIPIAMIIALLAIAKRRVETNLPADTAAEQPDPGPEA